MQMLPLSYKMALFLRKSSLCLVCWFKENDRFACSSALLIESQFRTSFDYFVITEEEVDVIHAHIPGQSTHA